MGQLGEVLRLCDFGMGQKRPPSKRLEKLHGLGNGKLKQSLVAMGSYGVEYLDGLMAIYKMAHTMRASADARLMKISNAISLLSSCGCILKQFFRNNQFFWKNTSFTRLLPNQKGIVTSWRNTSWLIESLSDSIPLSIPLFQAWPDRSGRLFDLLPEGLGELKLVICLALAETGVFLIYLQGVIEF